MLYYCPHCGKRPEIAFDECNEETVLFHSCDMVGNIQMGSCIPGQVDDYWNRLVLEKLIEGKNNG